MKALPALAAVLTLAACAEVIEGQQRLLNTERPISTVMSTGPSGPRDNPPETYGRESAPPPADDSASQSRDTGPSLYTGTDSFLGPTAQRRQDVLIDDGSLVINFENAELSEVVRVILGDALGVDYVYDPRVQGLVSLQTTGAMPTDSILAMLETVLRMNGAALIIDDGIYKVLPAEEAVRGNLVPQLGGAGRPPLPPGHAVQIVPLRFVSAIQMEQILEPFVPPDGVLRTDVERNLLVLSGNSQELERLNETIQIFDVDWLAGMSVGIFPLENVPVDVVIPELDTVFGSDADGPLAGMIRFMPVERLNALLVVTPKAHYLRQAEVWISRLDRGTATDQNLYVFYLNNGKAAEIAKILTQVFEGRAAQGEEPLPGRVAPGNEAAEIGAGDGVLRQDAVQGAEAPDPAAPQQAARPPARPRVPGQRTSEGLAFSEGADIRIIADEINNALLILASPQDYRMVEAAVRKLDIVPLQVLVEATIAEVTLNNDLRYGVQWFFEHGSFAGADSGDIRFSSGTAAALAPTFPGFAYTLISNAQTRLVIDALENVTSLNVISSPHLMIQDNQEAEIQVGDEVPVVTQQQQSTSGEANLVNTVEYRDTGVILRVRARVNSGGAVNLEIEQEVSAVQPSANATLTPTISQRRVKSTVVVQSGETVVLGGLIEDSDSKGTSGLPLLSSLPVIGPLFGSRTLDLDRTELIVLITPRVVRDHIEARRLTDEIRSRMQTLRPFDEEPFLGDDDDGDGGADDDEGGVAPGS